MPVHAVLPIAFDESGFVGGEHSVHLLTADDCVLEVVLHLVNMPFELLEEVKHVDRLRIKVHDLVVLLFNSLARDVANEREVRLDAIQQILRGQPRQQGELALQVYLARSHEDEELLRFDEVGASRSLANKHVEEEGTLLDEAQLARAETLLRGHWRHVHAWKSVHEELSEDGEVTVAAENLEAAQAVVAHHRVLKEVASSRLVRVAH